MKVCEDQHFLAFIKPYSCHKYSCSTMGNFVMTSDAFCHRDVAPLGISSCVKVMDNIFIYKEELLPHLPITLFLPGVVPVASPLMLTGLPSQNLPSSSVNSCSQLMGLQLTLRKWGYGGLCCASWYRWHKVFYRPVQPIGGVLSWYRTCSLVTPPHGPTACIDRDSQPWYSFPAC